MTQTDRIDGLESAMAIKAPVLVATTENITLSGPQTIDGVSVVAGNRVLVKNQTIDTENGIYLVQTGTWSRAKDFDGARDATHGTLVYIQSGATSADTIWQLTTTDDPVLIGTSSITWAETLEGGQTIGSSITSNAIAVASKSFTTQAEKYFSVGRWLLITSDANTTNYMHGQVTAYSGTALTVNVTNIGGAGTFADWTITVSGTRGSIGVTGDTGDTGAQGPQGDPGIGTVTSVATAGLATGGPITGSGTVTVTKGTGAEIDTGTEDAKAVTPKAVADAVGSSLQGFDTDTLKADVDDTLTAGFGGTDDDDDTQTTGTYTPTYAGGNFKLAVNGGAHTLAPQSGTGTIIVQYTNDGSAGAITTSGFDIVTGDAFTTTDGHDFMCYLTVVSTFQHLHVVALQ